MGETDFEEYYRSVYKGRWEKLRAALLEETSPVPYSRGLCAPYTLDRASVLAAESLRLPGEGTVLDACAAPGGKSLVIASAMGAEVRLLANELSGERRRRLVNVLGKHLSGEQRSRVTVSGFDAAALAGKKSERERFSGILLDAPCSSERHVLADKKALAQWTPARPVFLARRQWALLSSAFLLLKPGYSLVYATCAVSSEENDRVAARLMKKYSPGLELDRPDFSEGEETEFGRLILPDRAGGMGPMYVARFRKL
ncbi:16S rRNA methyltransferase [Breznakiella homolactica]|uniref:16S rRNA methyltransferase n=1 Tax=Breznakiella homolactica TaxID=2798577 RepID=A0A7T7XJQ3_9SPIR|nr:16S rRNA methyltransferase [Breznakiella homolactica]QQO07477.1 16S rRNA methyltransferase [Breznakiella homolactica]